MQTTLPNTQNSTSVASGLRRLVHLRDGIAVPREWSARVVQQVIARSLYVTRWFDLSALPKSERIGAVQAQLAVWQPFEFCDYRVVLHEGGALAFAWDAREFEARRARCREARFANPGLLPETLLNAPLRAGARVVQGLDGFAGEFWDGGILKGSSYWPELPSADEWLNFLRGASAPPALHDVPVSAALQSADWLRLPWARLASARDLSGANRRVERVAVAGGVVLLVALAAQLAGDARSLSKRETAAAEKLVRIKREAQPVIAARDAAQAALPRLEALAKSLDTVSALSLLAHLTAVMPKDAVIRDLDFDGLKLKLGLSIPESVSRLECLKALRSEPWFGEVREASGGQKSLIRLEITLTGLAAPQPVPPQSAAASADAPSGKDEAAGEAKVVAGRGDTKKSLEVKR
ncbi:hypothetical protein [Niveibacterium umoris]|nr:hypothetical protein [Niveibacterium umoris]